jgi:Domain of unknown function (DUF1963)
MEGASSRRGFLRNLMRESAKSATEAGRLLNVPGLPLPPRSTPPEAPAPERRAPLLERARPSSSAITSDALLALAEQHGLGAHLDDIAALARHSVRLTAPTLQDDPVGAWLAEPSDWLLDDEEWPVWDGERLTLVAQLDLTDPVLRDVDLPLPPTGRLLFLWPTEQAPSGQLTRHGGAGRVLHVPARGALAPEARVSVELTLPRVWAAAVQALGLDPVEHDGYLKLRRRLATLQDVELDDGFGLPIAYHRVLGYPNETGGLMPLTCELTRSGRDATDLDAADDDVGVRARRWRMLLQLTADEAAPWSLGGESGRLYMWIAEEDLRAADFSRVHAISQPGL